MPAPPLRWGAGNDRGHLLAQVRFDREAGAASPAAVGLQLPLPRLAGAIAAETWWAGRPVQAGQRHGIAYAASDEVCFGHLLVRDDHDLEAAAADAYRRLHRIQADLGFANLLRVWHYLRDINAGAGDAERYKRFCAGRAAALAERGRETALPAATVVGGEAPGLQMHFLLTRTPPAPLENPRQVSAYHYPRRYGPARPAFARAARIDWPGGPRQLFVSGTASILGHESVHTGDAAAQLAESLANVEALLAQAGPTFAARGLAGLDLLKIYLRRAADCAAVERGVRARLAGVPWVMLRADLCRQDLLVEVEAQLSLPAAGQG